MSETDIRDLMDLVKKYENLVKIATHAFADIAFSDDMTLKIARAKAKRMYQELKDQS